MAVCLMTDSTADLPKQLQAQWDIDVVPLGVVFDGTTYLQGVDITIEGFYQRLTASKALPTTSQVNPDTFIKRFLPYVERGDSLVVLCLSGQLSGTYQSACIAREEYPQADIRVIDSRTVTIGMAVLLDRAVAMRNAGRSAQDIAQMLEDTRERVAVYAIIDDLTYLHKGGRLSAVGSVVGGVLRLKPVVSVHDGIVNMAGLTRGQKNAHAWVADRVAKDGVDADSLVIMGHTHAPDRVAPLEQAIFPHGSPADTLCHEIGAVVGTHAGPGATAISFIKRQ